MPKETTRVVWECDICHEVYDTEAEALKCKCQPQTREEKLKHCSGCYNDFYNNRGDKDCWSLEDAHLQMRKEVHVDHVPPWNQTARPFFKCYRKQRYVYVGPNQTH